MPPPSPPPAYEILPNDSRAAVLTRSGRSEVHLPSPSSPVGSESTVPQRVQNLWFDDGNIVIQAGNALYRVYRGALASRSSVFQDMISFPQPPEAELVEGCPFVELPDPEVDVTPFLRAIFEPEFFMPFPAPTEFDVVVGCLRLGHKYGVEYLRRRALVHFSSGFPTTLSQFDRYMYEPEDGPSKEHSWRFPEDPASRIRAILVAREVDAPWLLPRAFYTLAVHFDKLGMAVFNGAVYNGLDVRLSAEDQKTFSKGYIIQKQGHSGGRLWIFIVAPSD
ncbi:BTB domain-containing protein [Mycena venus]|uniref:BTB domain-containing protein n=1 Tax=Mycena venus TaxID=2733690 RepID=A0A8H6Y8P2_9AGAR|nr:BTB domain-containing protein [Mycena venus]